ncbi:MAG: D-2-hydroxyacid dehydrogenase [Gammaproteobacteria bacterium]|nr:D-2-hydroxyacid dehydrogenase [Gammaproteobacteria bacterium]
MARESDGIGTSKKIILWNMRQLLGSQVPDRLHEIKAAAPGYDVESYDCQDEMESAINGAEIVASVGLSAAAVSEANNLRWLNNWGAGIDHGFTEELVEHPVVLTSSKGNGAIPLAEHAMLMMLMLNANAAQFLDDQKARRWERRVHVELNGQTVGIIGLGHSGADLAHKCKAFHMRVLGLRRTQQPCPDVDELFTHDRLHEFLRQLDHLVIAVPMTSLTEGMLGEAELRVMKSTAHIVVFSRGGIIEDEALVKALNEGWIAGAALDAHTCEPLPTESLFWYTPNTIITPHAGAVSTRFATRTVDIFVDNLRRYVNGEPMRNVVDKQILY